MSPDEDDKIVKAVGEDFFWLDQEVSELHSRHKLLVEIFGGSEATIATLNDMLGNCGRVIQESLIDGVVLGIMRLADKPQTFGQPNLTLERMIASLPQDATDSDRAELGAILTALRDACSNLQTHRHKRLAHSDHQFTTGAVAIPGVGRKEIEESLRHIREFMNYINLKWLDSETAYEYTMTHHSGDSFLHCVEAAAKVRELCAKSWAGHVSDAELAAEIRELH